MQGYVCHAYLHVPPYAISAYHHLSCDSNPSHGEVYLIQHYVINFVSDL
jgi:hypothetical protein